ncbi:hypothetical protein GYMLUDRAFT_57964 [Collybiopsis luxurians FD-317 M1]|uniref:Uncharacterized protein n=1 Tax=Collybiopsis luxurians FD-317 M1 TaxID=944289 RepID=A0A0D0CIY0_9AGAR|nr:hypothetical protein GYMLUDRAFT_57964 [Collybiopsis luxurians FD-317 M1]
MATCMAALPRSLLLSLFPPSACVRVMNGTYIDRDCLLPFLILYYHQLDLEMLSEADKCYIDTLKPSLIVKFKNYSDRWFGSSWLLFPSLFLQFITSFKIFMHQIRSFQSSTVGKAQFYSNHSGAVKIRAQRSKDSSSSWVKVLKANTQAPSAISIAMHDVAAANISLDVNESLSNVRGGLSVLQKPIRSMASAQQVLNNPIYLSALNHDDPSQDDSALIQLIWVRASSKVHEGLEIPASKHARLI